jgi:hypothetical protein
MLGSDSMGDPRVTTSVFPSALALAPALVELGVLKNGLGSLQNLEVLLKSIKVGQKLLFAAVAAVHADCAPMIASVAALSDTLIARGVDGATARQLTQLIRARLGELETLLSHSVRTGRLLVTERLKLENELGRFSRDLVQALPLAGLLDRAAHPRPEEPTPVELLHDSSVEAPDAEAALASLSFEPNAQAAELPVDLAAGRVLIALAVALVGGGDAGQPVHIRFGYAGSVRPATRVSVSSASGQLVRIAPMRLIGPSLDCARAAAGSLGGAFEYEPDASRACIYWPVS